MKSILFATDGVTVGVKKKSSLDKILQSKDLVLLTMLYDDAYGTSILNEITCEFCDIGVGDIVIFLEFESGESVTIVTVRQTAYITFIHAIHGIIKYHIYNDSFDKLFKLIAK